MLRVLGRTLGRDVTHQDGSRHADVVGSDPWKTLAPQLRRALCSKRLVKG